MRSSIDPPPVTAATGAAKAAEGDDTAALLVESTVGDEAATEALAARLAAVARSRDVIALRGDLGAGKTVFARAFIRARMDPDEEVPSPTFTLVQVYEPAGRADAAIWHFDLFRLTAAEDALELGIEDAFGVAISLIEWPERLGEMLPASRLDVTLAYGPTAGSRRVRIEGDAAWRRRLREAGIA
jgi:tRNA threonylcarbamoyladenosine biosynthesis protein TsaE